MTFFLFAKIEFPNREYSLNPSHGVKVTTCHFFLWLRYYSPVFLDTHLLINNTLFWQYRVY